MLISTAGSCRGSERIEMRRLRKFVMLLLLCICGVALIRVLAFGGRDSVGQGEESEETIVGWVIGRIESGEIDLSDEADVRRAIAEGEQKFGVVLAEETEDRIVGFTQTLDAASTGADDFARQAKQMYEKYAAEFVEQANDKINGAFREAAEDAAHGFVESIFSEEDE